MRNALLFPSEPRPFETRPIGTGPLGMIVIEPAGSGELDCHPGVSAAGATLGEAFRWLADETNASLSVGVVDDCHTECSTAPCRVMANHGQLHLDLQQAAPYVRRKMLLAQASSP